MTAAPDTPLVEKRCSRCGESKHLDEFHLCKTGTQCRAHWCKECYRLYALERKSERAVARTARAVLAKLDGRS